MVLPAKGLLFRKNGTNHKNLIERSIKDEQSPLPRRFHPLYETLSGLVHRPGSGVFKILAQKS